MTRSEISAAAPAPIISLPTGNDGDLSMLPVATEIFVDPLWAARATAGFGAAAGRSPFAMQNIGQGGIMGMQSYEQQREIAPQIALRQAELGKIPSEIALSKAKAYEATTNADVLRAGINYHPPLGDQPQVGDILGNLSDVKNETATNPPAIGGAPPPAIGGAPSNLVAPNLVGSNVDWKDESPELQKRVSSMLAAMPPELKQAAMVNSGYRSPQEQAEIYERSGHGTQFAAAAPGHSLHEQGLAADWQFGSPAADQWVHQNAGNFGLSFPLGSRDPNHMQLAQAQPGQAGVAPGQPASSSGGDAASQVITGQISALTRQYQAVANGPGTWAQRAPLLDNLSRQITDLKLQLPVVKGGAAGAEAAARVGPNTQEHAINTATDVAAAGPKAGAEAQAKVGPALTEAAGRTALETGSAMQKSAFENADKDAMQFVGKLREEGKNAQGDVATAELIKDLMPRVRMGWRANDVQELARVAQGLGASDEQIKNVLGTNPASGDALNKLFLQFSTQAVRAMGAREPGSVIGLFSKVYPNLETVPHAAELMTNVLSMNARWKSDMANAAEQWHADSLSQLGSGTKYRGMTGFMDSFAAAHNPLLYEKAAEAMAGEGMAWRAAPTKEIRDSIINLIPSGSTFIAPDGQPKVKP